MGRIRYYCEYCDRSFLDDIRARKKHLTGTQHARMKKQYYMPYRSAKEIYEEEKVKGRCRKHEYNSCVFGANCRFSHYSVPELEMLRLQAEQSCSTSPESVSSQSISEALGRIPSLETLDEWMTLWKTKHQAETTKPAKPAVQAVSKAWSADIPGILKERTCLPPSLQPWSKFNFLNIHVEDWG